MSGEVEHTEVTGVIPMHPGHGPSATCTCGWHSHSKTFAQHLAEMEAAE